MNEVTRFTWDELFAGIRVLKAERDQLLQRYFATCDALLFYLDKSAWLNNEYRQCCGHDADLDAARQEVLKSAPPEVQETIARVGLWPIPREGWDNE